MKITRLNLSEIVTTAGTQIRAKLCTDTVDDYATAMEEGAEFPPVVVFHDGNRYILADGFHRVMAASRNRYEDIKADIRKGSKSDALKYALTANASHGLKRTNADKRRSVVLALAEWPKMSSSQLAKVCGVHRSLVDDTRKQHAESACSETRIGADGKERKLPKRQEPEPESEEPEAEERPHIQTEEETRPQEESVAEAVHKGTKKLNEQRCLDHITNAILQFEEAFPGSKEILIADLETHIDRLKSA